MANKRDDDLDSPRRRQQQQQQQRPHARSMPALHAPRAPRRSVALRLGVYVLLLAALGWAVARFVEPSEARLRGRPLPVLPVRGDHAGADVRSEGKNLGENPGAQKKKVKPGVKDAQRPGVKDAQKKLGTKGGEKSGEAETALRYRGPLRFPRLGGSMRPVMVSLSSSNVLFAAGSARAAAALLPLACAMAAEELNSVHFVLLSRSDVPVEELLRINGVGEECRLAMHDARPDYSTTSEESRMRLATVRALQHMHQFMISKAIIVDVSDAEEDYFLAGVRDHVKHSRTPLIELPRGGDRLSWLAKLDATALSAWNDVHIDVLIHAAPAGLGNIKRLLKSLSEADLGGVAPPRVTIELPSAVDHNLANYLAGFRWPASASQGSSTQMLSLRHRVPQGTKRDEDAESARFIESFWPASLRDSHVLVLSPHAEVTPQFFQYVKYLLLRYRYSDEDFPKALQSKLLGISLATPRTYLNGAEFTPPRAAKDSSSADGDWDGDTPFLWQAPDSDALLIMGDKWAELHGYVSQLLEKRRGAADPASLPRKETAKQHPAWLEHALQLSRLRGYATLYPGARLGGAMLGIHTDLHDARYPHAENAWLDRRSVLANLARAPDAFDLDYRLDLAAALPGAGQLPPLGSLPWVSWDGRGRGEAWIEEDAALYRQTFRAGVGQCGEERAAVDLAADAHAKDLFCAAARESKSST
ncbi:hypothetical protein ESCO_002966 [Escovopsis weberi]|uniref:Glycosyltransferase 2 n=1 Tax=Escovopsis weberi TaxID=150374 RepID=A0A0N0RT14_ESCWE|nr:hypothetical protein ESCO_002966 [Escovopsis weberi]